MTNLTMRERDMAHADFSNILPLHRGVRPYTGEQLSRIVRDPDALFRRHEGDDLREYSDRHPLRESAWMRDLADAQEQPTKLEWAFVCLAFAGVLFAGLVL